MAAYTGTRGKNGLIVTKWQQHRQPGGTAMTSLTRFSGTGMTGSLTGSTTGAIVTTGIVTGGCGLAVIHGTQYRNPHGSTMTGLALFTAGGMRRPFTAHATGTVVTTRTSTGLACNQSVVKLYC